MGAFQTTHQGAETCGLLSRERKAQNNKSIYQRASQGVEVPVTSAWLCVFFVVHVIFSAWNMIPSGFTVLTSSFPRCFCLKLPQQVGSPAADRQSHYLPLLEMCVFRHCQVKQNVEEGILFLEIKAEKRICLCTRGRSYGWSKVS